MTNAILGYHSFFDSGTVSASSDPGATPKENAHNWRLDDYWQPASATANWLEIDLGSAQSVDYFAFYSSDLYLQAGAAVKLYGDSTAAPTTLRGTITPTTRGPKLLTISPLSLRYWRIEFSQTASYSAKIQVAAIGQQLELEQGLRPGLMPPALGSRNHPLTNISAGGIYIGRSMEPGPVDFKLSTTVLSATWVRANWPALLAHIERYPFFCLPEPDGYPDEAVIAWTGGRIETPRYSHSNKMSLNLALQAFI